MPAEVVGVGRNTPHAQERGRERRAALLEALEEQLQHRSLAEVSLADVTTAAGLGRSAFYFYFSTKQAAVAELLSDMFDDQVGVVSALLTEHSDPRDGIRTSLEMTVRSWREHRHLFLAMLDARDSDPATRAIWEAWLDRYRAYVTETIVEHRRQGLTPPGHDAHALSTALLALNERTLELHLRAGDDEDQATRLHQTLVHIWTAAIFGGTTS